MNQNCVRKIDKFKQMYVRKTGANLLLPQANGSACVDFGCTHSIDGLF
jgi:hypothetical protein